jgi:predicted Zn-dependent peptidase
MTLDEAKAFFERHYHPQGAILSVAGKVDWGRLCRDVEKLFGDWAPGETPRIVESAVNGERLHHMPRESSQTHIAIGYDNIPYSHPDYYKARGAVGVLSDGMSSRLFTEVREKRGLSYSVYAMCHSLRDRGSVLAYAQTSVDKAQEACDVMLAELRRLKDGIEPAELSRLKARVKRALIMQQESSSARAAELASDWYYLGRVRTLAEIAQIIDQLTVESINAYLAANPPRDFRVVTLGGQGVEVTDGVS